MILKLKFEKKNLIYKIVYNHKIITNESDKQLSGTVHYNVSHGYDDEICSYSIF